MYIFGILKIMLKRFIISTVKAVERAGQRNHFFPGFNIKKIPLEQMYKQKLNIDIIYGLGVRGGLYSHDIVLGLLRALNSPVHSLLALNSKLEMYRLF